jgi:signal transduction histidine kinase
MSPASPQKTSLPAEREREEQFLANLNSLFEASVRLGTEPEFLQKLLDASLPAVAGHRGFLALMQYETGELKVVATVGEGWTDQSRAMRLHLAHETSRGISGHVVLKAEPYITGDVDSDPYYLRIFDDVKSEIAVPIMGNSTQARGVINVDSPSPDAFAAMDTARLTAIAQMATLALGVEGFRDREQALIEGGKTLTATLDTEALVTKVVEVAANVLRFEDCSVFLLDEQTDHLVLKMTRGALTCRIGDPVYHVGEGITGWVAKHGEAVRLEAPREDPRWLGRCNELPEEEIGPFLAVPIISRDKVLGVLRILRRQSHSPWFSNRFTEVDERVMVTIASQLGAALENAQNFERLVQMERMAAWGELSARSAHMIGNRSFALKGDLNELNYLLEALSQSPEKKEIVQLAESMGKGIDRLEEILREFRDFVVATQLKADLDDINNLLLELVRESFPKRSRVKLEMDLAEGIPPIRIDAKKLKRAFSELIENAISFQPDGGFVRITSRLLDREERVANRLAHSREYVLLEFADAGPGVPEALKERIFQPFFTSRVKGMGLGLSIVKGIIEAHQGLLRETGVPGEGARFQIFLPVCK